MALNVKFLKGTASGYAGLTEKNADTFYYTTDDNNLYLGGIKLSNGADLANAVKRIEANEKDIEDILEQLETLTGEGDGSIAKMIAAAKTELETKIKANTDAIAAINDEETGILKQAKNYADGKDTAIAAAKKAGDDAQADVDALEKTVENLAKTVTDNETDIEAKVKAISDDYLKASDKKELSDAIEAHKTAVDSKVTTLIGNDADKSVRTIANEELAAQLLSGKADADFKTLQELAAWLEDHPEDVTAINKSIDDLEKLVGTLPEGATATDIVGYIAEAVKVEKDRAELAEKGLDDRLKLVESAVGEGGSVATQINDAIAELDADVSSAEVEEGKGVRVQVVEVDGKVTTVAVTGNFDNSYDAKGAAATAETNAKSHAETKASAAETAAKAYADGLAGNYDPAGSASAAETNAKKYVDEALTWGTF